NFLRSLRCICFLSDSIPCWKQDEFPSTLPVELKRSTIMLIVLVTVGADHVEPKNSRTNGSAAIKLPKTASVEKIAAKIGCRFHGANTPSVISLMFAGSGWAFRLSRFMVALFRHLR